MKEKKSKKQHLYFHHNMIEAVKLSDGFPSVDIDIRRPILHLEVSSPIHSTTNTIFYSTNIHHHQAEFRKMVNPAWSNLCPPET